MFIRARPYATMEGKVSADFAPRTTEILGKTLGFKLQTKLTGLDWPMEIPLSPIWE